MAVVYLKTTSGSPQTWPASAVPSPGTLVKVENWGAGSGGSGGSTSFRAGGAAGAYATSAYTVTPNDFANGISFTLGAGSSGTAGANPSVGPDCSFSTNNLNLLSNSVFNGAVVGTPGTLPTNEGWASGSQGTLSTSVVAQGISSSGYPYLTIRVFGTTSTTAIGLNVDFPTILPTTAYTASGQFAITDGSLTNISSVQLIWQSFTSSFGFLANSATTTLSLTPTLTSASATGTSAGTAGLGFYVFQINFSSGVAIDFTFTIAAPQLEQAGSATFYKSTPGYCLAKGGGAASGTTGGVGGAAASCIPVAGAFSGGSGATRTQGGGGGGAAGPLGAGTSATTGTGATANNGTVAAFISSTEGGGGATAAAAPLAAGSPGGGGGANTSTGSGSNGGQAQIRLSWADIPPPAERAPGLAPFRTGPGRGPRPLVPQPWRGDFSSPASDNAVINQTQDDQTASITAAVGSEPIAARSPFRLLPGRGPRPLVPQPWLFKPPADAHADITATQDDQTIAAAATNLDTAVIVQTQADQTIVATAAVGAEPIASRSPFRLLPGRGPRPLVPQPWRYYVQNANAVIAATQDDQTVAATATIGAEPIAARSPFRLLPGRGPRPLVPQPWRYYVQNADATVTATQDDQTSSITATIGAEPLAVRSPFRLLPGRGPRPLVPNPWRGDFSAPAGSGNAIIVATQDDQTVSIAATNLDHVAIVQTQDDQTASITATSLDHAAINQTQDDQTAAIIATISAEPIAARSPFRLLPGRGPRPLVPQPWRYYVPLANVAIVQTQDDQTASVIATSLDHAAIVQTQDDQTASIAAANLDHAAIVQTQDDQTALVAATNLTHAAIAQTQDDQTSSITASVGAAPIAARSPFRLLPGRGPRPLVPNPWRYVVQADLRGSIVQTQDDQTISAAALLTHVADIDQNQDDHTISSTAALLAAAAIAQTQSNQTIVSAATNRTHAAIVQAQDDQTIVATALLLVPRTAAIVQTQQDQTIHMAAGLPRVTVAQPQFLW